MLKMFGWVFVMWGVYAGLSAYVAGNIPVAIMALLMSVLLITLNIGGKRIKTYTAMLCIRDDDNVFQFPVGVASSLPNAGALVKIEALTRQAKEVSDREFTTSNDYYVVQERELDSARILPGIQLHL
jgi:hypothetical protein